MSDLFKNKVTIVTGGGSGIGRASAILFAKEGALVVIANRSVDRGEEAVNIIKEMGGEAHFVKTDICKKDDIINLITKTVEIFGRLDCAFNCAGIDGVKKNITDIEEEEWNEVIDTNLKGTFFLLKYEIKQMLKQGHGGTIVNMASINGLLGRPKRTPYNSSRSGIISLTKTTALEYIKDKIRINCVAPAAVDTDLFLKYTKGSSDIMKQYESAHPIGRICTPEEVAEAALWLLSEKSSFVVGHTLVIDGGASI